MRNILLMIAFSVVTMGSYAQMNEGAMSSTLSGSLKQGGIMSEATTSLRAEEDDWMNHPAESYAGGTGTEADPYLIETPEQLVKLAHDATGKDENIGKNQLEGVYFKQIADIDLSRLPCNRFGIGLNGWFAGTYDGNGYFIFGYNLNFNSTKERKDVDVVHSLFCNLRDATIKNVNMEDCEININFTNITNSWSTAGLLVAYTNNTTIQNCHISGNIEAELSGKGFACRYGGIAGVIRNNTIINDCSAYGTITGNLEALSDKSADAQRNYLSAGGIVSEAEGNSKIINCISNVEINNTAKGNAELGISTRSAGIVTWCKDIQILNCSNQGNLTAKGTNSTPANWVQVGGIGSCILNSHVENCWNTAGLTSEGYIKGEEPMSILCYWENTTRKNCFLNKNAIVAGWVNNEDTPLEESYMKSREFVDLLNENLPEGGITWKSDEGNYPALHTVNAVILPQVVGATTDPVAGEYEVLDNAPFQFKLTLDAEYDKSTPVVTVNGKELTPNEEGFYVIEEVNTDMVIEISGIEKNPVANEQIEKNEVSFYTQPGTIVVQAAQNTPVSIYTFQGVMQKSLTVNGTATIPVSKGLYILKIGDKNYKVMIK